MKDFKIIKKILETRKRSRDDDHNLYFLYLKEKGFSHHSSLMYLFSEIEKGSITGIDNIKRYRRMIQQRDPSLRGKTYLKRKIKQQAKVKTEILINHG